MIQTTTPRQTRIKYRATRGSGSWTEITDGIDSGSLDIDDFLTDSLYHFGVLNASKFECKLYQDIDLTGNEILVDQQIDGLWRPPIFHGFVESSKEDNTHTYRTIVAYDEANKISEVDISDAWETYWSDRPSATIAAVITWACQQVGYTSGNASANPVSAKSIGHSIDLSNAKMTFGQLLYYMCELCGYYPHISCEQSYVIYMHYRPIYSGTSLVGLYDTGNSEFEDYSSDSVNGIIFFEDGVDRLNIGSGNKIFINNNPLVYDRTDTELYDIGMSLRNALFTFSVNPCSIEMIVSAPDLTIGECVSTEYGNALIMHKRLYGVQLFNQTLDCYAEKTNDFPTYYNPEIRRLHGRVGVAEAQLEVLDDEIATKVSQTTYTQGINAVNARVDTTNGNVTALGGRVDTAESDISTLDGRLDTAEGDIGTLETGVSGLTSRVTTAESTISQQATQIASKVSQTEYDTNKTATDNRLSSAESDIGTLETGVSGLGTRMSSAESNITQNAQAITTKVSSSEYNGQSIVSKINQSASTVQIDAKNINLNGVVTANETFQIDENGYMTATGGKIANFVIGANDLTLYDNGGLYLEKYMDVPVTTSIEPERINISKSEPRYFVGESELTKDSLYFVSGSPSTYRTEIGISGIELNDYVENGVASISPFSVQVAENGYYKNYASMGTREFIMADAVTSPSHKAYIHDNIVAVENGSNSDSYLMSNRLQIKDSSHTSYITPSDISINGTSPFAKKTITSADSRIVIDDGAYVRFGNIVQVSIRFHATQNISHEQVWICNNLPQPLIEQGLTGFKADASDRDNDNFYWFWSNGILFAHQSFTNFVAGTHYHIVFSYVCA